MRRRRMREQFPRVAIRPRDGSPAPRALESLGPPLGAKVNQDGGGKAGSVRGDGGPHSPGLPVLVLPADSGGGGVGADGAGAARVIRISEVAGERRRWRWRQRWRWRWRWRAQGGWRR